MKKRRTAKKKATRPAKPEAVSYRPLEVPGDEAGLRARLAILEDSSNSVRDRCDAMQSIQAASFSALDFDSVRSDYVAVLRKVSRDPDAELRQRALGHLARINDAPTQKALLDGLKNPAKALVPAEKALQLLGYDPHSGAYDAAREILKNPPNEATKREAVRMLSSDPQSAPLLEKVLANKQESVEVRRMSAAALHALQPDKLQNWANKAVLDDAEDNEMVATCLTAIQHFGSAESVAKAKGLGARLKKLEGRAPAKVKQLAKKVKAKYAL